MYESFFGLTGPPFRLTPDPSFLFVGKGHRDAFAALRAGLTAGASVMVLTGEVGAGKTTLLQALLASVDPASTVTAHISAAHLDAEMIAERFSEALRLPRQPDPLARRDELLTWLALGPRATLLVIDEAQHLSPSALDLLETLADATALPPARLQICLVGQPELRILLNAAQRSGFRALIGVDRHLGPLEQAEVRLYVEHRLHRAGWTGRPEFEDAAFTEIFIFTAGNPRRINLLCNSLMLCACLKKQQRIDAPAVTWAAAAMREDSFQGAPDLLDLGSHFEHRPTLTEAFEPDTPEFEATAPLEDAALWSCPSCRSLNASTATKCWSCEAVRPGLDAAKEPPGETSRAPEDTMTARREAVHVEAASTHAADDPASVTAAEPRIGAPEFTVTAPPDAVHTDAASAHAAHGPASVMAAEPARETINAPEDAVTALPDALIDAATSAHAADDSASTPVGDGAAEFPGEPIRAPEDTVTPPPEAEVVDAATSAHAADDPAPTPVADGAAEFPGEPIRAPEDTVTPPPEAEVVDAATSAHAADDLASTPVGDGAAEFPGEPIHAPDATVTAPPDAEVVDATTSAHVADDPAFLTTSDETSHEIEAVPIDPLAGIMRQQVNAARRRRQAILTSAAFVAVALVLLAYVVHQRGLDTGLSQNELRNIVANRTTSPAPPRPALDPLRGAAGSVAPESSAQASAPAPSPDLASRARATDAAAAKAPADGENARGRVADQVPGAAGAATEHALPVTPAPAATSAPPCSGPAFALGLCDAGSSSTRR